MSMTTTQIRAMRPDDLSVALDVMEAAMADFFPKVARKFTPMTDEGRKRTLHALARTLSENHGGSFVTVNGDGLVDGMAVSVKRDGQWGLALLFVHPDAQGRGIATHLLKHASHYGADCTHRVIVSSENPAALRLYLSLGLRAYPGFRASGIPQGGIRRITSSIEPGSVADIGLVTEIDRANTTATRGEDIRYLLDQGARLVLGSARNTHGFAVLRPGDGLVSGSPVMLAADTPEVARDLLLWTLQQQDGPVSLYGLTATHHWAIDACDAVRLTLRPGPTLCYAPGTSPPLTATVHGLYF
ncbi:GNAT family N-acetyltransferase [Streptomyces sp. NPDC005408]|uniref:GNAT family N-acetyltransferase n=1 Tax=Streptomyces sp. NPDC005408 TaxID=3155341 RepID=UPI0033AD3FFD